MESKQAQLIVLAGPDGGRTVRLNRFPVTMGRSAQCDIQLTEQHVSREHAELSLTGDGVVLEVRSSQGLRIGRKTYKRGRCVLLDTGDVLRLGVETSVLFVDAGADAQDAMDRARAEREAEGAARRAREQKREKPPAPEPADETEQQAEPALTLETLPEVSAPEPEPLAPGQVEALRRKKRTRRIVIGLGVYVSVILLIVVLVLSTDSADTRGGPSRPTRLKRDQIAEILRGEPRPKPAPDNEKAAEQLERARRYYRTASADPANRYRCIKAYKLYRALSGRVTFADATDGHKYDTSLRDLVAELAPLYERACNASTQERWHSASQDLEKIAEMVPDQRNPLNHNVRRHLHFIETQRAEKKRRTGPGRFR